jgi:hypothetical protein
MNYLVKADGHDTIGRVKGLFDAVAVMNIDINVQNTSVTPVETKTKINDENALILC